MNMKSMYRLVIIFSRNSQDKDVQSREVLLENRKVNFAAPKLAIAQGQAMSGRGDRNDPKELIIYGRME